MTRKESLHSLQIPDKVLSGFREETRRIVDNEYWVTFAETMLSVREVGFNRALATNDPRRNWVHWAFDVDRLCREIALELAWFIAWAIYWKQLPSDGDWPRVSYQEVNSHADNAITRVFSCRDKLSAMVMAYFVPFDPNEKILPDYKSVVRVLKDPSLLEKFVERRPLLRDIAASKESCPWTISGHESFTEALLGLRTDKFQSLQKYRHMKVHRREPIILLHGNKHNHTWSYSIPAQSDETWFDNLKNESEDKGWGYTDEFILDFLKPNAIHNGILYEEPKLLDHLFDYDEIADPLESCYWALIYASTVCLDELMARPPLDQDLQADERERLP